MFWLTISLFLLHNKNLINSILYSEIVWVVLYVYVVVCGVLNDELTLITTSFLLLALAGLEFCLGFLLTIYFRNFKKTFNLFFFEDLNKNKKININNTNLFL